eukprot:TRINITY_DN7152_c0_g2_i2.p2 TRINITY_DN7152_c0_g2~~TRINITY_DN7152_c0_g2_i2.p2  ORF type:complete len:195 (-),score=13.52 TRINITY_DN7152_c0_g2_i2:387-971(-)
MHAYIFSPHKFRMLNFWAFLFQVILYYQLFFLFTEMVEESREVIVETSIGNFGVELYSKHSPNTCRNFMELSRRGYYDGTVFHRIIKDFMIQGGDPSGTGRGGESIYGGKFKDEITRELKFTGAGIVAMANSGPDTNGSQFFVTLAPTPWLDGKHTIFGRISWGMKVVQRLGLVQTDRYDRPINEVKIIRARPG